MQYFHTTKTEPSLRATKLEETVSLALRTVKNSQKRNWPCSINVLHEGCTNSQKTQQPPQNCRLQKGYATQIPHTEDPEILGATVALHIGVCELHHLHTDQWMLQVTQIYSQLEKKMLLTLICITSKKFMHKSVQQIHDVDRSTTNGPPPQHWSMLG
jgi:hypothetical protein